MTNALHILCVEDNKIDAQLLEMCVKRYASGKAIILDVAVTIEQAIECFDINKHAAALIDWNLPDGEGIEVVKFIRELSESIPLFMLTGALSQDNHNEVKKYKNVEYLEKNFNKDFIHYISKSL